MTEASKTPAKRARKMQEVPVPCVHRSMRVAEILTLCPGTATIMAEYGLHCFSCSLGGMESIEEGCSLHGMDDETLDALIEDLNDAVRREPSRPQELTITPIAARAISGIARKEGRSKQALSVLLDRDGSFCMEFQDQQDPEDLTFSCDQEPDVQVHVSPITLWRIGGATIDYRDGQFTLDLQEEDSVDI